MPNGCVGWLSGRMARAVRIPGAPQGLPPIAEATQQGPEGFFPQLYESTGDVETVTFSPFPLCPFSPFPVTFSLFRQWIL